VINFAPIRAICFTIDGEIEFLAHTRLAFLVEAKRPLHGVLITLHF